MNAQLIEKLIKSNKETCPEFTFSNPLLDQNVSKAVSKSFVKILKISKENLENKNIRLAVLQNIRNMCKIEPDEHVKVDENLTEFLTSFYEKRNQENKSYSTHIEKDLDAFLLRTTKDIAVQSSFQSAIKPEVAQALINLNNKVVFKDIIKNDIIHWNQEDKKCLNVLKELWNNSKTHENINNKSTINLCDDVSLKIKTDIEILLLNISHLLLQSDIDMETLLSSNNFYGNLIEISSISPLCFQICISILNTLFIMANFNSRIQDLICRFVQKVKFLSSSMTFAVLYPTYLTHIVISLDIDLDMLPLSLKANYSKIALDYLNVLHKQSENDLIMVLSHFPQWYDIYFKK